MISKIVIKNFKSLEDVNIDCSNLNVLTGLNGMGKSSIIQALLLLRQSYERGFLQNEGLSLNGDLVNIGTGKEALYEFAKTEEINFSLEFSENSKLKNNSWYFTYEVNNADTLEDENKYFRSDFLPFSELDPDSKKKDDTPVNLETYTFFKRNTFQYLNADRWVKNEYDISDFHVIRNRNLGIHGEFTTHFLDQYGTKPINPEFLFPGIETNELLLQVSAWMSEISPGTKVKTERIGGVNSVKLRYQLEGNGESTSDMAPLNVGFGITYVLPVLVSLLSAREGDIIIIENPESHIHPKGQSSIGKLMAKVAESGVQIFVETHSDHIINGILVSLNKNSKNIEKGISLNNLKINFIGRNENNIFSSKIIPIKMKEDGRIHGIPEDFFDQYSKDMKTIIGF